MSKAEQEKTDKMLIKSLEREERERKRVGFHPEHSSPDPALERHQVLCTLAHCT